MVETTSQPAAGDIIIAAQEGRLGTVQQLVEQGSEIDVCDFDGKTALMAAALAGHIEIVRYLLERGAEFERCDIQGNSALLLAAQRGHVEVVKALIQAGCNCEHTNLAGRSAAYFSFQRQQHELIDVLRAAGAAMPDVFQLLELGQVDELIKRIAQEGLTHGLNKRGNTLLIEAVREGHIELVRHLLALGTEVDGLGDDGMTALMWACHIGFSEAAGLLIEGGAQLDILNDSMESALWCALHSQQYACLGKLLDAGCNMELVDDNGETPLLAAVRSSDEKAALMLLEYGAHVDGRGESGKRPLFIAARQENVSLQEVLLAFDASPFTLDELLALGNVVLLQSHLQHGAYSEAVLTAALQKVVYEHPRIDVVEQLIAAGARPEHVDAQGNSCLHLAVMTEEVGLVELLLNYGLAADVQNDDGLTPLQIAASMYNDELVEVLTAR